MANKYTPKMDLTGNVYDRLTVLCEGPPKVCNGQFKRTWDCRCICGEIRNVLQISLTTGNTASCGCARTERAKVARLTHGLRSSGVYVRWCNMIARCHNPKFPRFIDYGGRGITVCERWRTFENFFADMGHPPEGKTLERRDNDKGYNPENCYWADTTRQANNKRSTHLLTWNGKTQSMADWAREVKLSYTVLRHRVNYLGWSDERALATPYDPKSRNRKVIG